MCRKNPISKISFPTSLAILDYTLYNPKIAKGFQLRFQVCVCAYTWVRQSQFIHSINCGMTAISLREAVFRPLEEGNSKLLETLCTTLIRLYITTKTSQKPYENSLVCVPVSVHNAWGGYTPIPPMHKCHVAVGYLHKILHNYKCMYGKGDTK